MNAPALLIADQGALVSTRFTVPGMRCAGCIAKIERELPKTPGISAARANFSAKRVAIRHDPEMGEAALTEALRDLARWLYRQLEAEYDHLTSDESIEEGIIVNEYTFTEGGRRFG